MKYFLRIIYNKSSYFFFENQYSYIIQFIIFVLFVIVFEQNNVVHEIFYFSNKLILSLFLFENFTHSLIYIHIITHLN